MTEVLLPNNFQHSGWQDLDKDLLNTILSEKGQKIFMAQAMKVKCDESFRVEDSILREHQYAKSKFRKTYDPDEG
jgi:hypothetical protein